MAAHSRSLIVGIAGGSGSGKTHLAKYVANTVGTDRVALLSMDQYFRTDVADQESARSINFDHPAHLDFHLLIQHVQELRAGTPILAPSYDFRTMRQTPASVPIDPLPVVLVEGLFVLAEPMVGLCDLTCFLDVETDERLLGRLLRDLRERGATAEEVIDRYQRFVRPSYRIFVEPTKQNADVVVDFTFRRAFFTELLTHFLADYIERGGEAAEVSQGLRAKSLMLGIDAKEGYMSMTADIFQLAEAYPERVAADDEGALPSPAASTLGDEQANTQ